MTLATRSPLTVHVPLRVDPEQEIVARLIEATGEAGLAVDPASIINFYMALTSFRARAKGATTVLVAIAAVYLGFELLDGRRREIAAEKRIGRISWISGSC